MVTFVQIQSFFVGAGAGPMCRGTVAALAVGLVGLAGDAAFAMSLQEAVHQAVNTHPQIYAAQAGFRASGYVLGQAQGRFFPEVDVDADVGKQKIDRPEGLGPDINNVWRFRRRAGVTVRQILFDGFERANEVYRSQALISAASQRVLVRSQAIALNTVEAYIDVRRHLNLLALAQENVKRHQSLLKLIRERYEGGKAPIGDVDQTIERVEAAKSLVVQISQALGTAKAKFRSAVGAEPENLQSVGVAPGVPVNLEEARDIARQNNPRVAQGLAEIDVADFEQKKFRATFLPEVYLEGTASKGHELEGTPGPNDELAGKIVLRWKLMEGGVRLHREAELGERYYEKVAELDAFIRQLIEEVEISWTRLVEGRKQVELRRTQLSQNEKIVAAYRDEYNANKRSLLDVLDAETSRFASQFELSNTQAIFLFSGYQLLAHSGKLLAELGISAPDSYGEVGASLPVGLQNPVRQKFVIPSLRPD